MYGGNPTYVVITHFDFDFDFVFVLLESIFTWEGLMFEPLRHNLGSVLLILN